VLDVACGEGEFIRILVDYLNSYVEITGIDILEYTKAAGSIFDAGDVRFVQMEAGRLGFDDECLDTVSLSSSLHHLEDVPQCLGEMKRVLRPGGHLIIRETHRDIEAEPQRTDMYIHHWVAEVDTALGFPHNMTFARQELIDLAAGLELRNVELYDVANTDSNPNDEANISDCESVIERYMRYAEELPDDKALRRRGEELRRRLHRVGIQWEPELIIVGEKYYPRFRPRGAMQCRGMCRYWAGKQAVGGNKAIDVNYEDSVKSWKIEEDQPFTGWDFSYLDGRMVEEQPPWSYLARAGALMRQSTAVLDMGTGGGERLLELRDDWPDKVVVTEDYAPNAKLAEERLGPLGVKVVNVALTRVGLMPFDSAEFDLVLNRHSGLNCAEVARILAPGGTLLTQQVHGMWAQDLLAAFGTTPKWPDATPDYYLPRLEAAGLSIETAEEWLGKLTFHDVGAVVYYLKAVPWLVEGFSVDTHTDDLIRLQRRLEDEGELVFEARKHLIEVRKVA
jgi:ubiquinone/menaquinone biosynthesis C-methylase UbiE